MQIENYTERYKDTAISLLSQRKNSNYDEKKKIIWDWQYKQSQFHSTLNNGVVINDGGSVVGFNGYMYIDLLYNDRLIHAVWSTDTIISPECRGKGFGGKLVDAVKESAPVVIGLGISDAQSRIMIKHKYSVNTDIEQYFYTNKIRNVRDVLKMVVQYFNFFIKSSVRKCSTGLKVNVINASNAPKEIDALWEIWKDGYRKIVNRDYSYIYWKYGKHPINKYKLIIVKENESIAGIGVFRNSDKTSRFVDYIGPSSRIDIKQLLINTFKNQCADSNLLECTSTDEEFKKALEYAGFVKYKNRPRFYIYSNITDDRDCHMDWFVMGGDSDSDLGYWD